MELKDKNIGYVFTGAFYAFSKSIEQLSKLVSEGANIIPIMSEHAYSIDVKFGKSAEFVNKIKKITGNNIIHSIQKAEKIGLKKNIDAMVVIPATGNTIAKLSNGIADTTATVTVKSHLRNNAPVVLGISAHDGLSTNAENIRKIIK